MFPVLGAQEDDDQCRPERQSEFPLPAGSALPAAAQDAVDLFFLPGSIGGFLKMKRGSAVSLLPELGFGGCFHSISTNPM